MLVAILARKADYLRALAGEIRLSGATVLELSCDVSDRTQITEAFSAIRTDLGEPEVLLYNAGSGTFGNITEIAPDEYEVDWRVNAFGAFLAAKEVAPGMIKRGRGHHALHRGDSRREGRAQVGLVWTCEVAMRGLAQSLARDLGPKGIHVAWITSMAA